MELLAPVGSKEAFITAVRAGADAVYMGVPGFNARAAAAKLSLYDLEVLIDHAQGKGVKVFLALNTLVKHEEIHEAVRSIAAIARLSPDAVIVQDLGVASIILRYFPELEAHASTQMAVHNRMGVDFLARAGFKRAILARELSFSELKIIAAGAPIALEVFCHGALCFSMSGLCLFSSYIGGLSGNRGRCTQPCRRLWRHNGGRGGYLFSPRDLELAEHIPKLKKIGISCLKIEGRMRSSEYVYRAVKAYRLLIDAAEHEFGHAFEEAKTILAGDTAREKTACLFSGRDAGIFQPKEAQCLGNPAGMIKAISAGNLIIEPSGAVDITAGDRLRLSNPATDTTIAFKVKEFSREGSAYVIPFEKSGGFKPGNPVYRTVDAAADQKDIEKDIDALYEGYSAGRRRAKRTELQLPQTYTALISNVWKESKRSPPAGGSRETLRVRFDDLRWLDVLPPAETQLRYVYSLTKENLHPGEHIPRERAAGLAGELPPFIGQRDLPLYKRCIEKMTAAGVHRWVVNNIAQVELFRGTERELSAGHFLYVWNAYTAAFLAGMGVTYFTASWEDDFLNIRKLCGPGLGKRLIVYLYGFPPVVRSRMITPELLCAGVIREHFPASGTLENREQAVFSLVHESGMAALIPEKPVNIFTARRKFRDCGIENFGIDLSFTNPDKNLWNTLLDAYDREENIPGTGKFNYKRGVK